MIGVQEKKTERQLSPLSEMVENIPRVLSYLNDVLDVYKNQLSIDSIKYIFRSEICQNKLMIENINTLFEVISLRTCQGLKVFIHYSK